MEGEDQSWKGWRGIRTRYQGYSGARPDVLKLVESSPVKVLDVGCGAGWLGSALATKYPGCMVVGIEPDPELAKLAERAMSVVINARIDAPDTLGSIARLGPFDLIICADVLEHLADPLDALTALTAHLSPNGRVITSIPNVRHLSTFVSLGLLGDWPSRTRGIHDSTHLRFFARRNILNLGSAAGLEVTRERRNLRLLESKAWTMIPAKILDFWPFRQFLTFQYLHSWKRPDES